VLGGNYSSITEQVNSIQQLLAYCLITETESHSPEVPGALFKKSKRPKSKNPPTKTKVTPPKPTEGSELSHSVSLDTVPDPKDLERNIQLASTRLPSTLSEGTRKSKPLLEITATPPKDLGGNIQPLDRDITSTTSDEVTTKTMTRLEGLLGDKDSGGNIPPADMEPIHLLAFLLSDDESKEDILGAASDTDSSSDDILRKYDNFLPLTKRQLVKYLRKMSNALFTRISKDNWENHEEVAVNYDDLKASIDDYYDENIAHRDQTDKLVEASISSLDKSSNTISDLYKGLNIIFELLKEIKNADKDDFVINKKITEATESFTKILGLERAQNHIQSSMSSLKEDTHSIKNMMNEMYKVFKGQSSGSRTKRAIPILTIQPTEVPLTQAQPITTIITHPKSSQAVLRSDKGKGITIESDEDISKRLVLASTIVRPDPDALIPYTINGEVYHLTAKQLQEQMDKEELIKKAKEEDRLLAISKPKVIKVVQEEAKNIGLDPRKIASTKAGEKFKKAQDAEHQVLKREHSKKVKKSLELRKHKFKSYMWTINNRLKPKTVTDIKIHLKTKPVVITVYRGTDGRNFDVHRPFALNAFSISELDKLREIIPKKKNAVVHGLMNSLSQMYERIRKIPEELGIKSALPAPAPKQA
ncbi:hypothetical protein Tco_0990781, partial [Tanacetum coccineum]